MKNKSNLSLSLRKVILSALVAAPLATLPAPLWALPVVTGNVTSNSAATTYDRGVSVPGTLFINDNTTNRLVLKWNEFGSGGSTIAAGETVRWNLASSAAAVLNMVSTGATLVDGTLSSNGQVLILNANGITLSGTSRVNTAGLVLSTIPEAEFVFLSTGSLANSGAATAAVAVQTGTVINIGSSGSVFLAGKSATVAGTITAGSLNITTQNGPVTLGSGGALTLGATGDPGYGNVTINSGGGAVNLADANAVTLRGATTSVTTGGGAVSGTGVLRIGDTENSATLNINAGTGAINLSDVAGNNHERLDLGLTASTTSITAPVTNRGTLRFRNSTISGALTVVNGDGSIDTDGDVTMSNNSAISLTANGLGDDITFSGNGNLNFTTLVAGGNGSGGSIKLVSKTGSVTLPAINIASLTVSAAGDITQTAATGINNRVTNTVVPISVDGGALTNIDAGNLGNVLYDPAGPVPTITINTVAGAGGNTPVVTVNPNGTISVSNPADAGTGYVATDTATISGGVIVAGSTSGSATFDSGGSITLANTANNFGNLTLKNAPGGVTLVDNGHNLVLANSTNVTGAATIASSSTAIAAPTAVGDIVFGSSAGNTVRFGSSLTIPSSVNISDVANNVILEGTNTFTSTGSIILDGNIGNGIGLGNRFGQINVTAAPGGVRLYETTTLNLGTITTAGTLRAYSSAGDIINTGTISAAGTQVGAGTAAAPGNITLNNASNALGTLTVLDDFTVLTNAGNFAAPGATVGSLLAKDLTIVSAGSFTLNRLTTTAGPGISGNLSITTQNAGSIITLGATQQTIPATDPDPSLATDAVVVAGTTTLVTPGGINAFNTFNSFGTVNVTAGGAVLLNSAVAMTVNATLTGTGDAMFRATGAALRLGTVDSSRSTGTVTFSTTGNNAITDTVNGLRIFGAVNFSSGGSVTINRSGHSFGLVGLTAGSNQSATIIESGTLRFGTVALNNNGNLTATSTTGDIIQDAGSSGIRSGGNDDGQSNTVTLTAPLGSIRLDDATGTTNRVPRLVATAAGDVVLNNSRRTALGNVTAGGKLTITSGGNLISQLSGTRLNVFDTVTLTNTGGNDITIGNSGNRLGGVVVSSGSGNITITESTTLNLKSVNTTGLFSATSESGNIIDSTDATVANNAIGGASVLGAATFSAPNGNVTLGLAGNNFTTIGFTTPGNVSVLDAGGNLTLSGSTIGGTFDLISTAAAATLNQSGALSIGGNVTLTTNGGLIDLSNTANQLGAVRFTANQVSIAEATTLNLRAGSVATGPVQLSTNANFITSGVGGSSFTNNLTISAQGTIIPGAGSLLVVGTFTVFSPSTKDLGALSKSGNLTNKDPINLGSGSYVPPGP